MKRIAFAIGSLFGGGAERVVSNWANALVARGYDVSVVVYSRLENEYPVSEDVKIFPIAESQQACNEMSELKRVRYIRKIFKNTNPDVVISFLPIMQIYVRVATIGLNIPRIETIRISPWEANILKTKFSKLWINCFETCNAVILQSNDQKAFFSKDVQKKICCNS